jgi:hypothetical protein
MKRRALLSGLVAAVVTAAPALAQDLIANIVAQLKRQGFRSVVTERTLLRRVRIVATRRDGVREIIVNPRTGEILRDLWTPASGGNSKVDIIDDRSGRDDDDDDDDDDDGDDDDDDDDDDGNSGSGGDSDDGDDDDDKDDD